MNLAAKRVLSFLIAAWMMLSLTSCAGVERDWLSYRRESGAFLLEGNRNGEDFSCEVFCVEGRLVSLCYLSPRALEGIRVTPVSEDRYRVERGELASELSEAALLGGLLLPAELILLREASLLSVQRLPNGDLLTLSSPLVEGQITVTLTGEGLPRVIASDAVTVRVSPIGKGDDPEIP